MFQPRPQGSAGFCNHPPWMEWLVAHSQQRNSANIAGKSSTNGGRFWRVLNWKIIEVNGGLLQQAMCTGRYFAKTVKPWNQWDLRAYEARNIWSNTRERGPIPLVLLERVFTVPASWMRQGCASLVPCKKKWSHNYGTGGRTIKTCHIERTSQISRLRCPRLRANELRILWNFSMLLFCLFFFYVEPIGSMVLLYMVCHGSHQYTPFMLALIYQHHGSVMGDEPLYQSVESRWGAARSSSSGTARAVDSQLPAVVTGDAHSSQPHQPQTRQVDSGKPLISLNILNPSGMFQPIMGESYWYSYPLFLVVNL